MGCAEESKGYRVWIPSRGKVEIIRDIKFLSDDSPTTRNEAHLKEDLRKEFEVILNPVPGEADDEDKSRELINIESEITSDTRIEPTVQMDGEVEVFEEELEEDKNVNSTQTRGPERPQLVRTGKRGRPKKQYGIINEARTIDFDSECVGEIPVEQAVCGPHEHEWYQAMAVELKCILEYDTWVMIERPSNQQVIGSRMILRNKFGPDENLEKRKARIVAKGFSQHPGIDFKETFSPVTRLSSIRLITGIASQYEMIIRQFDVTTAYLNGLLEKNIYMEIPEMTEEILEVIIQNEHQDFNLKEKAKNMLKMIQSGNKVCMLKKALYDLRQAGRQ